MKTTKVQKGHIRVLIEELEKLQDTKDIQFNMSHWCELGLRKPFDAPMPREELREAILLATKNPCGTSACLAGKAGLIPRIRRMGFKWGVSRGGAIKGIFRYTNNGRELTGDAAVCAFFGERVFEIVFTGRFDIKTIPQGIQALENFLDYS